MPDKILHTKIQIRQDSKSNWELYNPILLEAEMGLETDTRKFKFGDGAKRWKDLPYSSVDTINNLITTEPGGALDATQGKILNDNKLDKTGDSTNVTNTFTQSATRTNLTTGEKISISLGKIMKWFADLGSMAFKNTVTKTDLDATLQSEITRLSSVTNQTKESLGISNIDNTADASKNVLSASKWTTPRTLSLTQDATGSANIDGAANASISVVLANSGVTSGTYTKLTVNAKGLITSATQITASDIPSLTLSKITDAGTSASKNVGVSSGNIPILNANGKLESSILPAIAVTDVFVVANQAEMLALSNADVGDIAVRTDVNKSFILKATGHSTLTNWQELLTPTDLVSSVNGMTGAVTISSITGNAGTATTLQTARTIAISGGATGTATLFNGGANIAIPITVVDATKLTGLVPVSSLPVSTTTANGAMSSGDKVKLDGIASGSQVNVIETIQKNGVTIAPANKTVNIALTKSDVGLDNVPNVTTNNQTPTFSIASTLANLTSGETLATVFGKIGKAITDLIAHIANMANPHNVTKSQVGLGNVANVDATNAANITTGVLPVARGGIGVGALTGLAKGNGTSAFTTAVAGADYVAPSGSITGNAGSATKLTTSRTIALSGAVVGTATSFNGEANITIPTTSLNAPDLMGLAPVASLPVVTTSANGAMSNADKAKLDGIAIGATANVVENVLTSTSTTNALSSGQGKILNDTMVKLTGDQTITGSKTFSNNGTFMNEFKVLNSNRGYQAKLIGRLPNFTNGTQYEKIDIYLGKASIDGTIKISLFGSWNNSNTGVVLEKAYNIYANYPAINYQSSDYTAVSNTADSIDISDIKYNENNGYYVTVSKRDASTNNTIVVYIEQKGLRLLNLSSITFGAIYTTDTTIPARPVLKSEGKKILLESDVQNLLTSTSATLPLSANQGKVLDGKVWTAQATATEAKLIAVGAAEAVEETKIIRDVNEPLAPVLNALWLDLSVVPNQLKIWNGDIWEIVNDTELLVDAAERNEAGIVILNDRIGQMVTMESYQVDMADKAGMGAVQELLSSFVEQTASDMHFRFDSAVTQIVEVNGQLHDLMTELNTYINFSSDGIELGQANSPFKTQIENTKISFTQDGVEVAYISNNKLYIKQVEITDSMKMGGFQMSKMNDGGIIIDWIGIN